MFLCLSSFLRLFTSLYYSFLCLSSFLCLFACFLSTFIRFYVFWPVSGALATRFNGDAQAMTNIIILIVIIMKIIVLMIIVIVIVILMVLVVESNRAPIGRGQSGNRASIPIGRNRADLNLANRASIPIGPIGRALQSSNKSKWGMKTWQHLKISKKHVRRYTAAIESPQQTMPD